VLGRGGFATVYRARQLTVDRDVALKILDGAPTDERTLQLFTRECQAAGALSWHPHVVVVHDAGTTPRGAPYLAMELLPGGSVADALAARGPLETEAAVRVAAEVASALAAAHEMDLLHRDVKPANVLIDRLARAKLADFGIARLVGTGSATATGAVTGTVAYMAPEVLQGGKATPASDVYALGLTLLTCLAGRNPLTAESDDSPFAVIARVVSGAPLDVPASVPPEVRELIDACTARDPAHRPSAAEAETALAAVATGAARPAPPAPRPATPPPPPPVAADPVAADAAAAGPPRSGPAIPPPPTSAVRVRPDHTLAEPPPPAAPRPDLAPTEALASPTQVGPDLAPTEGRADPTQVDPGPAAPPPSAPRSRWPLAVAAAVVGALLVVGAVVLLGGDDDPPAADGSTDETTTSPADEELVRATDIDLTPAFVTVATIGPAWEQTDDDFEDASADSAREDDDCPIDPATQVLGRRFRRPAMAAESDIVHLVFGFADEESAARFMGNESCIGSKPEAIDGLGDEAVLYTYGEDPSVLLTIRRGAVVTQIRGPADPVGDEAVRSEVVRLLEAL